GRRGGCPEVGPDRRAAGPDMTRVVIHVLVRQRHAVQRTTALPPCELGIGFAGRPQRRFLFDRHEGVEPRLPLRDPVKTRLHKLARGNLLCRNRLCDCSQRHQGRLGAHDDTFATCTSRKLAGSKSNGRVPETGSKPSKAGPIELAIRVATSASTATPPASATALMSFGVGLVMPRLSLSCCFAGAQALARVWDISPRSG